MSYLYKRIKIVPVKIFRYISKTFIYLIFADLLPQLNIVSFPYTFRKAGFTSSSVKALTPYIIPDQIMIEPYDNRFFYEFPAITSNPSTDYTDLHIKKAVKTCGQKYINHEYISFFQ
jgi:hypothetical protein